MNKASDDLLKLLKKTIYKTAPHLRHHGEQITDFIKNADFIDNNQDKLLTWQHFVKNDSDKNILSEQARNDLATILKTWIKSKNYKDVTVLLKHPRVTNGKAIDAIIDAIQKKGNDIPNTIAEQFGPAQVSAGYEPLSGDTPRTAQITALKQSRALTVVTENSVKAHKTTQKDMQEVVVARNIGSRVKH